MNTVKLYEIKLFGGPKDGDSFFWKKNDIAGIIHVPEYDLTWKRYTPGLVPNPVKHIKYVLTKIDKSKYQAHYSYDS